MEVWTGERIEGNKNKKIAGGEEERGEGNVRGGSSLHP